MRDRYAYGGEGVYLGPYSHYEPGVGLLVDVDLYLAPGSPPLAFCVMPDRIFTRLALHSHPCPWWMEALLRYVKMLEGKIKEDEK